MVPDAVPDPDPERGLWLNALLGAVVTVLLSFVPFSPVLGGAAAGYLNGEDGLQVGAASGLLAALPSLAVPLFALFLFGFIGADAAVLFLLVAVVVVVWVLLSVALGAAGGYIGVALAGEYGPTAAPADPA